MPERLIDMVRSRIEAVRGERTRGQELGILTKARERIESIRAGKGLAGEVGIVERIGERFPALKRVRGQLEPFERPALFERGLAGVRKELQRETVHKETAETNREFKLPEEPRIF